MKKTAYIFSLLCFSAVISTANVLPDDLAIDFVNLAQDNFWGTAVGADGKVFQLPPDVAANTPLIPKQDALRIVDSAIPVGLAMSCRVNWQKYYLHFMQIERAKEKWTQTQIAFIGLLFGVAQNKVFNILKGSCTPERRMEVFQQMNSNKFTK
jgi:hypothetical protein